MKIDNDYPIYIEPDFTEIVELASAEWDTVRIMESPDYIVIGSGYGNSHESLMRKARLILTKTEIRRIQFIPYILYHEQGIAYFNLEDCSGNEHARWNEASRYFTTTHQRILKDLILESDLAL